MALLIKAFEQKIDQDKIKHLETMIHQASVLYVDTVAEVKKVPILEERMTLHEGIIDQQEFMVSLFHNVRYHDNFQNWDEFLWDLHILYNLQSSSVRESSGIRQQVLSELLGATVTVMELLQKVELLQKQYLNNQRDILYPLEKLQQVQGTLVWTAPFGQSTVHSLNENAMNYGAHIERYTAHLVSMFMCLLNTITTNAGDLDATFPSLS